mmetsp:Transcript_32397/g.94834  ORF Transcript_32397/g.94834 Transcript_32397/m.94834 type:complete len:310 (-) Transcript_32397:1039-1968(-)
MRPQRQAQPAPPLRSPPHQRLSLVQLPRPPPRRAQPAPPRGPLSRPTRRPRAHAHPEVALAPLPLALGRKPLVPRPVQIQRPRLALNPVGRHPLPSPQQWLPPPSTPPPTLSPLGPPPPLAPPSCSSPLPPPTPMRRARAKARRSATPRQRVASAWSQPPRPRRLPLVAPPWNRPRVLAPPPSHRLPLPNLPALVAPPPRPAHPPAPVRWAWARCRLVRSLPPPAGPHCPPPLAMSPPASSPPPSERIPWPLRQLVPRAQPPPPAALTQPPLPLGQLLVWAPHRQASPPRRFRSWEPYPFADPQPLVRC